MSNLILAEFKGIYRAPNPGGRQDSNVTKDFHVKVKMKRDSLKAPGLNGLFATYYQEFVKSFYTDMIDFYQFNLVEATELDGTPIDNPKALSYKGLLKYIKSHDYPIDAILYSPHELRNQVVLYEEDKSGQQHLEHKQREQRGHSIKISVELQGIEDLVVVVNSPVPAAPQLVAPVAVKALAPAAEEAEEEEEGEDEAPEEPEELPAVASADIYGGVEIASPKGEPLPTAIQKKAAAKKKASPKVKSRPVGAA